MRVTTPSGLWQKQGRLLMTGLCTSPLFSALFSLCRLPSTFPTFWPLIPFRAWFVASFGKAQWPCLTGRFPFERASLWTYLVPLKGLRPPLCCLNQQKAALSPPKWKDLSGETVQKYAFSQLHGSPLSWPLFPFKCPLFSSLLPYLSPPLLLPYANSNSCCYSKRRVKNPGAAKARSPGIFMEVGVKIKESEGFC